MIRVLEYRLISTKRRLTFEILYQDMRFCGTTDDDYLTFKASNGKEIISRSRMDIQTDRLWLLGCGPDERSGSMVFSSDEKRDRMCDEFHEALKEWALVFFEAEESVTHYASDMDRYTVYINESINN